MDDGGYVWTYLHADTFNLNDAPPCQSHSGGGACGAQPDVLRERETERGKSATTMCYLGRELPTVLSGHGM